MITIALLAAILVTLMVIAAILIGLLFRLDAVEQQVSRFRNEWVQLRRDDPGRKALRPARCFPAAVLGPVLRWRSCDWLRFVDLMSSIHLFSAFSGPFR